MMWEGSHYSISLHIHYNKIFKKAVLKFSLLRTLTKFWECLKIREVQNAINEVLWHLQKSMQAEKGI